MPTTFLDLLRAKVAVQLGLLDAQGARDGLLAVDAAGGPDALLTWLGQARGLDAATVARIDRYAARCMVLKGESFYLRHLRAKKLVPEAELQPIMWQVRQAPDGATLGKALLAAGLLTPAAHEELDGLARASLDADNVGTATRYRERGYEGIERESQAVTQVIAEGEREAPPLVPGEGTQILPQSVAAGITPLADPGARSAQSAPSADDVEATAALAAPASAPLPPELEGTGLDEKFTIVSKLGEGGMGVVYLAFERDDEARTRPMALKVVHRSVVKSKDAAARFKREILATSFCAHENIIEIYDAAETKDGSYYMAMELIEGEELADILKREGPLSLPRVVDLMDQALQGLDAVHLANIVHRDIKPQNFRISPQPDGREKLKIVDFGIARVLDAEDSGAGEQFYRTMGGKITGSPAYIAPESITEPTVDGRADLYSLGITIFRIATGRLPFQAKEPTEYLPMHLYNKPPPLRALLPEAPAELEEFVAKLLEKVASKRFQTAAEALEFLRTRVRPMVCPDAPLPESSGAAAPASEPAPALAEPALAEPTQVVPLPSAPLPLPSVPPPPPLPGAPEPSAAELDELGFTQPEMAVPRLDGGPPAEPLLPAVPEPAAPKLGFFARLWAFFFGRRRRAVEGNGASTDGPAPASAQESEVG